MLKVHQLALCEQHNKKAPLTEEHRVLPCRAKANADRLLKIIEKIGATHQTTVQTVVIFLVLTA